MKLKTLVAVLLLCVCGFGNAQAADSAETKLVREFFAAWHSGDIDKVLSFLASDVYYANHPSLSGADPVIKGLDNIRAFLGPFLRKDPLTVPFTFRTEIGNVIAGGDGVAVERRDVFDFGQLHLSVPVAAMFKVKDGKIVYWVDYFDGDAFGPVTAIMTAYPRK